MPTHKYLARLDQVWVNSPIFYVTTCTDQRRKILANDPVAAILAQELRSAQERYGWAIGRYVIMPDHVHLFCCPGQQARSLSAFMQQWKSWTSKRLIRECDLAGPVWQHGFFDHLLRSDESYEQKWLYVCANPVRAGLVESPSQWPWQGDVGQLI